MATHVETRIGKRPVQSYLERTQALLGYQPYRQEAVLMDGLAALSCAVGTRARALAATVPASSRSTPFHRNSPGVGPNAGLAGFG